MIDVTTTSTTTTSPTAIAGPGEVVSPALPEPGWRTSEFWLKVAAMVLTVLYASGALTTSTALAIAGMAAAILGALGYTVSRGLVKAAASRAGVVVVSSVVSDTAPTRSTRASASSLVLALVIGLGVTQPGCTSVPAPVAAAGAIAVDCIVADQAQIGQLAESFVNAIFAGGSWSRVEQEAIAAGKTVGGCALAEAVEKYLAPPRGRAAPDPEHGLLARRALEHYRSTQAGGATFHTQLGDL